MSLLQRPLDREYHYKQEAVAQSIVFEIDRTRRLLKPLHSTVTPPLLIQLDDDDQCSTSKLFHLTLCNQELGSYNVARVSDSVLCCCIGECQHEIETFIAC